DLGLTGTAAAHADARTDLTTGLPTHRLTPAAQPRQKVLELRELDLRLALATLRVLAEDVEDHRGAVDDLDAHDILEGAALARRQLGVGDDRVGAERRDDPRELLRLPLAQVRAGVGMRSTLQQTV